MRAAQPAIGWCDELMVDLLHEIWEDRDTVPGISHEMCLVSARTDEQRLKISPKSRCVHRFYASSYNSAAQSFNDWCGFGVYKPMPGPDTIYSDADLAEQQSYLSIRKVI